MLLAKHGIILTIVALLGKQLHDVSDLLAELSQPPHHIFFISKLLQDLLNHISQFFHQAILQLEQLHLIRLIRQCLVYLFNAGFGGLFELKQLLLEFFHLLNAAINKRLVHSPCLQVLQPPFKIFLQISKSVFQLLNSCS